MENKKVIEKFKDEAAGMPIREFIGLLTCKTMVKMKRLLRMSENMSSKRISHMTIIKIAY